MKGAIYVSKSENAKIAGSNPIDCTYVSIKRSCPDTCSLRDNKTCYAENGHVGFTVQKLDHRARGLSALQVARAEAKAIDDAYKGKEFPKGRNLRLHVSGDSRTIKGTRLLNKAIQRWKQRGGGSCWSYTHAWKRVPRIEWKDVSILASIERVEEALEARKQGYAPALVVPEHISDKSYKLPNSEIKWIPCVAQTRNIPCSDCKLCFNADRLFEGGFGITFAVHGARKNSLKRHLQVLQ